MPDPNLALFIHSAVGYALSFAFVNTIGFFIISKIMKEQIRFGNIYKIAVAGGFGHLFH